MPYQLEAILYDKKLKQWLKFSNPLKIITASNLKEVKNKLDLVQFYSQYEGLYAVGFICYEAANAFDYALQTLSPKKDIPLLCFGLFEACQNYQFPETLNKKSYLPEWQAIISRDEYTENFSKVKNNIREGNTYQVNYTYRQNAKFYGDYFSFFADLVAAQKSKYCAYIETDEFVICSASPELFFSYEKDKIITKPMKGTASRGITLEEDKNKRSQLKNSKKDRAENLMIVDMLRNDLGKIAEIGSVYTKKLFDIEKYPTVWQMTSTIEAKTKNNLSQIIEALFPCASITGAPKSSAMRIISEIENSSRGIYTGTIGIIRPDNSALFNVAIRTVTINKTSNIAECGVGGGIVWDSTDKGEYEECNDKTKFLKKREDNFKLLETILWDKDNGFFLLKYHLNRLSKSAEYFDFSFNKVDFYEKLYALVNQFRSNKDYKIRVLLNSSGKIEVYFEEFEERFNNKNNKKFKAVFANKPVKRDNVFLYHKTTNRKIYEDIQQESRENADYIILWNEKEEVTESLIANLVVENNGILYTPPVKSGLLSGTFREYLLDNGTLKEKVINKKYLETANRLFLINSVRKWKEIYLSKN